MSSSSGNGATTNGVNPIRLKGIYVRFYKSFNFDYLRKHHRNAQQDAWELIDNQWYPFVHVTIESDITTVVGANESGKSHLLSAIEKGISGVGLSRQDFCRYSQFFTVEKGKMRWPDFGLEWSGWSIADAAAINEIFGLPAETKIERFLVFRFNKVTTTVFVLHGTDWRRTDLTSVQTRTIETILPNTFRINAQVALPSSVPIKWLISGEKFASEKYEALGRESRFNLFDVVLGTIENFASADTVKSSAAALHEKYSPFMSSSVTRAEERDREHRELEFNLARDLILKVAKIDKAALSDLHDAIKAGNDGHANGIIARINASLASALNFPKWWAQDRNFSVTVSPREHDLVFTIRDRTATEYSFGERSAGLKYFLSYYVQYLAHDVPADKSEILLMDEPDAYLSSQAQQDLLRIFDAFAEGQNSRRPVQVIYVTHSPFLIDKNHSGRIRVLEKGSGDEGTRVIRNASKNHYEPLRSAFGAFVGETAFIGNCNLMVEGAADQILLAGAATLLKDRGATDFETLDLNKITIVPTGSASHVAYMVYLARGRDIEQPAVIVLLDSDEAGNSALKVLKKGEVKKKPLLKLQYILQIASLADEILTVPSKAPALMEIEDLIPLHICIEAAKLYLADFCERPDLTSGLTPEFVTSHFAANESVFKALEKTFVALDAELHLDKLGFARSVGEVTRRFNTENGDAADKESLHQFEVSFKVLFRKLGGMQRAAVRELTMERVGSRVDRAIDRFLQDFDRGARREQVVVLFEELENVLDDSKEADAIMMELKAIRRDFHLDEEFTLPVAKYDDFKTRLRRIRYTAVLAIDENAPAGVR